MESRGRSRRHWRQAGRSNTHTAVLATIIGAVMVAVAWSGQDLYRVAQEFMTRQDIESVRVLVLRYHAQWHALPGDDARAAARWSLPPARTPGPEGDLLDLTGDGRIDGPMLAPVDLRTEGHMVWRHMAAAGMGWDGAMGRVGFAEAPVNRFGGLMALTSGALGLRTALCLTGLPAESARRLDAALDDGAAATGRIRGGPDTAGADGKGTLRESGYPSDEERAVTLCAESHPSGR